MKSDYQTLMEELAAEGKVKTIPPEQTAKIFANIREALEDYRSKAKVKSFQSEQDLNNTILNA